MLLRLLLIFHAPGIWWGLRIDARCAWHRSILIRVIGKRVGCRILMRLLCILLRCSWICPSCPERPLRSWDWRRPSGLWRSFGVVVLCIVVVGLWIRHGGHIQHHRAAMSFLTVQRSSASMHQVEIYISALHMLFPTHPYRQVEPITRHICQYSQL